MTLPNWPLSAIMLLAVVVGVAGGVIWRQWSPTPQEIVVRFDRPLAITITRAP